MNGIIMIVTKTWTHDELQPAGKLENLVYSIRKSMVVSVKLIYLNENCMTKVQLGLVS